MKYGCPPLIAPANGYDDRLAVVELILRYDYKLIHVHLQIDSEMTTD
jgi:hypothetical protein